MMASMRPKENRLPSNTNIRTLFALKPCLIRYFSVSKSLISVTFLECFIFLPLVGDGDDRLAVIFHHVFDDLGSGVSENDVRFRFMVECCQDTALRIVGLVAAVDANTGESWNVHDERQWPLESLGKVHDAVVSACGYCRFACNFLAAADGRFHGVADEMALRVVFVGTPCLEVGVKVFVRNLHDSDGAVFEEDLTLHVDVYPFEFHDC